MALRGGNAMNKGTARKSAKFLKAPKKATSNSSPSTPMSKGAAKAKSKMMGGKGRMSAKHPARRK